MATPRSAPDTARQLTISAVPKNRVRWSIPIALLVLLFVPIAAGAVRLAELARGAEVTPENARFFAAPAPVVLHIIAVSSFMLLGAFQLVDGLRRRSPAWHRHAGRIATAGGMAAGLTGMWMTVFYPRVAGDGDALFVLRIIFGSAMVVCVVKGFTAVRQRQVEEHRVWMTRGYAIGLGAGTQAVLHVPWFVFFGSPSESVRSVLMGAGWIANLVIAEWLLRRRRDATWSTGSLRTACERLLRTYSGSHNQPVEPPRSR